MPQDCKSCGTIAMTMNFHYSRFAGFAILRFIFTTYFLLKCLYHKIYCRRIANPAEHWQLSLVRIEIY
jgi:hypothetical protein